MFEVTEVVTSDGSVLTVPFKITSLPSARCLDLNEIDTTRERSNLFEADIIDMESAAFAPGATAAGWRWTILRGLSDNTENALPEAIK